MTYAQGRKKHATGVRRINKIIGWIEASCAQCGKDVSYLARKPPRASLRFCTTTCVEKYKKDHGGEDMAKCKPRGGKGK